MSKEVSWSINTVSLCPTRPWQIARPGITRITRQRIGQLFDLALGYLDFPEFNLSLHPSSFISTDEILKTVANQGIGVDNVDIPDTITLDQLGSEVIKDQLEHSGLTRSHIGWFLNNSVSESAWLHLTASILRRVTPPIVRANAQYWLSGSNKGDEIINQIRTNSPVSTLAVEIFADRQTFAQYLTFVANMRAGWKGMVDIRLDLDVSHVERARTCHPDSDTPKAETALEQLLRSKERSWLAAISLSQYQAGSITGHTLGGLDYGDINMKRIAGLIGQALNWDLINKLQIVLETHPLDYEWLVSFAGISSLADLNRRIHGAPVPLNNLLP